MSGNKKHPDQNPLIFGPSSLDDLDGLLRSNPGGRTGSLESFDLESSSPFYDFWLMLRYPKSFFASLYSLPSDIPVWIWLKASALAVLGVWAHSFGEQQGLYAFFRDSIVASIDAETLRFLEFRLDVDQLNYKLQVLGLLFAQFRAAVAPFLAVSEVILGSGLLVLGLRFIGVPWQRIHFPKLLLLGIYLKFFYLFSLIPEIGSMIATPLAMGYGIFAVAKIFDLSIWRSLQAYFVVSFLVAEVVIVLAFVPLFILSRLL